MHQGQLSLTTLPLIRHQLQPMEHPSHPRVWREQPDFSIEEVLDRMQMTRGNGESLSEAC